MKQTLHLILSTLAWGIPAVLIILPFFLDITTVMELGKLLGTTAALTFLVTIIPGIIRRFKLKGHLKTLGSTLMYSRAQLGILMFVFGYAHWLYVKTLPALEYNLNLTLFSTFEYFGLAAILMGFPLFLTSNKWSKKKLKKNWNILHRLVYLMIWAIVIHIALAGELVLAILIAVFGILQIASLVYAGMNSSKSKSKTA